MGVSNSENMLLSEKDLNAVEFNFLVKRTNSDSNPQSIIDRDSLSESESESDHQDQDQDQLTIVEMSSSSSSSSSSTIEPDHNNNRDNGFKTPTSLEHKIPAAMKCPPAPRKPKPAAMKRRFAGARRRILLDVSAEIESLFPPAILADLLGGKIRKLRQASNNNGVLS